MLSHDPPHLRHGQPQPCLERLQRHAYDVMVDCESRQVSWSCRGLYERCALSRKFETLEVDQSKVKRIASIQMNLFEGFPVYRVMNVA